MDIFRTLRSGSLSVTAMLDFSGEADTTLIHDLGEDDKKWKESGFRPLLCTYRLNWARSTSWGWWDDWDDTVLRTHDSKFEPCRCEAEHATSRSLGLPTILTFTRAERTTWLEFGHLYPRYSQCCNTSCILIVEKNKYMYIVNVDTTSRVLCRIIIDMILCGIYVNLVWWWTAKWGVFGQRDFLLFPFVKINSGQELGRNEL